MYIPTLPTCMPNNFKQKILSKELIPVEKYLLNVFNFN